MLHADGRVIVGESGSALSPGTGPCPVQVALNGSTGATLEEIYFNLCRFQTMYSFGVPVVEGATADGLGVVVTGQGWRFPNGTYVSILFGTSALSGNVLWNTTVWGDIYGDVVPSKSGHHVYAIYGSTLQHINATDGNVTWSLDLGIAGDKGTALSRDLVLSPDDSLAVVYDDFYRIAVGVDALKQTVLWTTDNATLVLGHGPKPAFDAGTGSVLVLNETAVTALDASSGKEAWVAVFPDPIAANAMPSLALDAGSDYAVVATVMTLPAPDNAGALLYAVNKATGAIAGRFAFNASLYTLWGQKAVIDAPGAHVYVSLLGPHLDAAAEAKADALSASRLAAAAAAGRTAPHARQLQAGGSIYIAAVPWDAQAATFGTPTIVPAPDALQGGFPVMAVGPAPGQLTLASGSGVGMLMD
jgi:hypothetical protein